MNKPAQVFSASTLAQRQLRDQYVQLLLLLDQLGCSWNADLRDPQCSRPIFKENSFVNRIIISFHEEAFWDLRASPTAML